MTRWLGWIVYLLWGLLCFLVFFHLLFPYEALGRRILLTFEERTTLATQSSKVNARFLGVQWDRVHVSSPTQSRLPPVEIRNWRIRLGPLYLITGRLSVTVRGSLMGGSVHTHLLIDRKGHRGSGEWHGLRIEQFPISPVKEISLSGISSGRVLWEMVNKRVEGDTSFELQDARIDNISLAGLSLPRLNLSSVRGQVAWEGDKIDVKEIHSAGGELEAKLTGNVLVEDPYPRSKLACRLELSLTNTLLNRYPAIRAFYQTAGGQSRPLIMGIRGTLEAPEVSLSR